MVVARVTLAARLRAVSFVSLLVLIAAFVGTGFDGLGRVQGATPLGFEWHVKQPRVVVLKSRRVLHLFDGDRLVRTYPFDLGIDPEGDKKRASDGRTPLGSFRIVTKNPGSDYHRFLGINYPHEEAVIRGLAKGLISAGEAASIRKAHVEGRRPDWTTSLGGGIGLHGHRKGRDWTGGCVALDDAAIEELYNVLRVGDPVEILP
jgi:murein L,D-transpeptidase YafK